MSASDLEMVSDATRRIGKAFAVAPHRQIVETYWNTAMQLHNIWSVAFETCKKAISNEVCWTNGPRWILHTQTGTRFEHKSITLNPSLFNQQGITSQRLMISTALNLQQSVWNSLITFRQTMSIFFLWQSVSEGVYEVQIQWRESRKLLRNG
jgi:hypothetical protein